VAEAPAPPALEPAAPPPAAPALPAVSLPPAAAPEPIVLAEPELIFAARVGVAEPPRPQAALRRGVFFDVENSSRPEHVAYVLDHLRLDWADRRTEIVAVGNWRVVSVETARLLARRGAHLVHSAPSTGVRDWSDLRIAVAAGVWLAAARPGDSIEVVSDDVAFDAIGDVAASLGIGFRRLSFGALGGRDAVAAREEAPAGSRAAGSGRRGRRGRRGRGGRGGRGASAMPRPAATQHAAPVAVRHPAPAAVRHPASAAAHHPPAAAVRHPAPATAPPPPPTVPGVESEPTAEAHAAPAEEIRKIVDELLASSPQGVTLDALSQALKAHGFRRPPGSLRLITRLRHLKGIEVTRSGLVRLRSEESP
jgi:hypothetical protein